MSGHHLRLGIAVLMLAAASLPAWSINTVSPVENVRASAMTLTFEGRTRSMLVLRPTGSAPPQPAPAFVLLHYLNGDGADMADLVSAGTLVRDTGAWVLLPEGLGESWNESRTTLAVADDVAFINQAISIAVQAFALDAQRIYIGGYSNGGRMAERVACEAPQRIAAVASVVASLDKLDARLCAPPRAVPVMLVHGTADPILPYDGNLLVLSAPDTARHWADLNGCSGAPSVVDEPDTVDDGTRVQRSTWAPCASGGEVQLLTLIDAGHTWPGTLDLAPALGTTSQEINALEAMWAFVSRFRNPAAP